MCNHARTLPHECRCLCGCRCLDHSFQQIFTHSHELAAACYTMETSKSISKSAAFAVQYAVSSTQLVQFSSVQINSHKERAYKTWSET